VGGAWYGRTWDWIQKEYWKDPKFKESFDAALRIYHLHVSKGHSTASFFGNPTNVFSQNRSGYKVEMSYWFIRLAEFQRNYECEPEDLDCKTAKITCELGLNEYKGVLVLPTPGESLHGSGYRVVTPFSEQVQFIDELVVDGEKRLSLTHPHTTLAGLQRKAGVNLEDCSSSKTS
jgi:hypothetical protein